jgi:hypothetical protein
MLTQYTHEVLAELGFAPEDITERDGVVLHGGWTDRPIGFT